MWQDKRIIFNKRKAQLPIAEYKNNGFTIYYTSRNELNQNVGYKLKLTKDFEVIEDKLILEPGKPGSCDAAGVMPTAVYGNMLYYMEKRCINEYTPPVLCFIRYYNTSIEPSPATLPSSVPSTPKVYLVDPVAPPAVT